MKLKTSLLAVATLFGALGLTAAASAATLTPGQLIKSPIDSAVYYYAANNTRLVFPNEKTYDTWYSDFSGVTTISSDDLAAIPLGGNVTYRPGVKMVKITTDPKVYAVGADGTLHWVTTEDLATQLYGSNWNTQVDDVSDAFFTNYTVGSPIQIASDYSPSAATTASVDIDTDKGFTMTSSTTPMPNPTPTSTTPLPTTPTSTSATSSLALSVSKTSVQGGDDETLMATVTDNSSISKIELFFDGALIKTCTLSPCSGDTQIPTSGTKDSYIAEARLTKLDTSVVTQDITVPVSSGGTNLVQLSVGQATITASQMGSATVNIDASINVMRVDIYVDGTDTKGCLDGSRQCRWSDYLTGGVGSTHPVYAIVTDTLGRTYTSATQTITIGTNDTPSITVTPAKTTIYANETVDVTVSASDNDGIASIDVMKDGAVLKHCVGAAPCTATTGPWPTAGTTLTFTGQATDSTGLVGAGGAATVDVVTQP